MKIGFFALVASVIVINSSHALSYQTEDFKSIPSVQGNDPYPPGSDPVPEPIPSDCITGDQHPICVDDIVIPEDFRFGTATVVHVNSEREYVIVRGDSDLQLYQRRPFQLFLVNGCADDVCGGESVVPDIFATGFATVTAVNPFRGLALVQGDIDQRYYTLHTLDIAMTEGCLSSVCVRDIVFPRQLHIGRARVVAINFNKFFAVVLSQRDRRYYRLSPNDLIPDRK